MPAASDINLLTVACRVVYNVAVMLVAQCICIRIVSAALLPHINQHVVCKAVIYVSSYPEIGRFCSSTLNIVSSLSLYIAEVQPVGRLHSPLLAAYSLHSSCVHNFSSYCITHIKLLCRCVLCRDEDCNLYICRKVSNTVYPNPFLGHKLHAAGQKDKKQYQFKFYIVP